MLNTIRSSTSAGSPEAGFVHVATSCISSSVMLLAVKRIRDGGKPTANANWTSAGLTASMEHPCCGPGFEQSTTSYYRKTNTHKCLHNMQPYLQQCLQNSWMAIGFHCIQDVGSIKFSSFTCSVESMLQDAQVVGNTWQRVDESGSSMLASDCTE
mgnify:CR=1 FL=1